MKHLKLGDENIRKNQLFEQKSDGNTVELGYNDIDFYVTSFIASDTLWYELIPRH